MSKNTSTCQEIQNETAARPSRCTSRSYQTGVLTGLGRSTFERGDGPTLSSSRVTSALPKIGGEKLAIESSSRSGLSIPPSHLVGPVSRSLPLLPAPRSLSRPPVISRACVGDRPTQREWIASAHASAHVCHPPHFPGSFTWVPKYIYDSPSSTRTLPHPIARPPSILDSSVCLHAYPGPRSLILGLRSVSGCREREEISSRPDPRRSEA
jgi:hypothetical protein